MNPPLSSLTVLVTGASAGIGRALAAEFCKDGAQVIGFARNRQALEETRDRVGQGRMRTIAGDLASEQDVVRLFAEAGKVDVLVNNGAIYPRESFLPSGGNLAQTLAVNVLGMARCIERALPGMLERGYGRIVNLGSFAWKRPIAGASAYSISKAAVATLTRAVASEIDRERYPNVLVNELVPGEVRTSMSAAGKEPPQVYPEVLELVNLPAGGPIGQTWEDGQMQVEPKGLRSRIRGMFGG